MARGRTSEGATTWVKPALRACSIARLTSASSSWAPDAGQEVEARARHLGAALHVDGAEHPAQLDVVARLEPLGGEVARRADRLEHGVVVLAAGRRVVVGEVGDREDRGLPGLLGLGLRGLGGLHLGGQRLGALEQRLLLLALGLRNLLAQRLLLAPLGLEVADRLAATLVGRQRLVDHRVGQPALGLGGTHAVGLVTENAGVDHTSRLVAAPGAAHARLHRSSAVDVRRCLLRGPTPSYFCPCWTAPASCSWAGPAVVPAVRSGAARGRPGLGSGQAVRQPWFAGRGVRSGLGLAGRAAARHRGHLRDRGHDDHDRCRSRADARPRTPAGRPLHRRRHGDDHRWRTP